MTEWTDPRLPSTRVVHWQGEDGKPLCGLWVPSQLWFSPQPELVTCGTCTAIRQMTSWSGQLAAMAAPSGVIKVPGHDEPLDLEPGPLPDWASHWEGDHEVLDVFLGVKQPAPCRTCGSVDEVNSGRLCYYCVLTEREQARNRSLAHGANTEADRIRAAQQLGVNMAARHWMVLVFWVSFLTSAFLPEHSWAGWALLIPMAISGTIWLAAAGRTAGLRRQLRGPGGP